MDRGIAKWLLLQAFLAGCSGGGGGNITLTSNDQGEDPVVLEIPVAYIRRPLPEAPVDLRDPLAFNPGARLYVRDRAQASADEMDVTAQIAAIVAAQESVSAEQVAIDIKDLESSYDGKTLVFAARAVVEPVGANLAATTWNLWTFDFETMQADYLIASRIKRDEGVETGGGHDIAPYFLPDDRIVFSSTRQVANQARQLNEGRNQIFAAVDEDGDEPAAVLHIYDPRNRAAEITQISFNLSHDLDPSVLASGEIIFSRWNNTATDHLSIYRIDPSGLALSPLYGFHSQNTGTGGSAIEFSQPRELDDGRLVSVARPFAASSLGGEIVVIDANAFADLDQPTWHNPGAAGPGHEPLTTTEVRTDGLRSRGGQFGSVFPLHDGTRRLLVTWSECRVVDAGAEVSDVPGPGDYLPCTLQPDNENLAPPLYGAWIYSPVEDTQGPVVLAQEGFWISEIVAAEPRDYPGLVARPLDFNSDLAAIGRGQLLIDSVYDLDGSDASPRGITAHAQPGTAPYRDRPARFLRVVQPVPLPLRDVFEIPRYAFGISAGFGFREISGYVPIEPDGSVTVTLPAGRPFSFDVLDAKGRRIGTGHNYWLQLAAGEVLHCSGCHAPGGALPHGRLDSQPPSSNPGARPLASGTTGFPGSDATDLFATEPGQTMAQTWDFHRPLDNPPAVARELSLSQQYVDEWSAPGVAPDAAIIDRDYDPAWTDIPAGRGLVVGSLDPGQGSRIVINYIDHIQVIWERERDAVPDSAGNPVSSCVGCHSSGAGTAVPAGQLDLGAEPSDIDPDHYRSYRELLDADDEQWLDNGGAPADRQRACSRTDAAGNTEWVTETVPLPPRMQAGSASASEGFFACFEGGSCGLAAAPPLPENCTEEGGVVVPRTRDTVDHTGLLSAAELRLLAEWLDIGAQYYNNPFDARLAD
ncbi:MAG: PD40 domain-containing protein [Pseudomonadales bacterium]|nr:PD40 domain-containing protein [Halioglobus sp.]MCP5121801.1 PD40 domain-containing protein [Pseudomonadales bacterium]MCP5192660.1 PD40 domain-containing protein [Pseudomonadales bacterium]